MRIIGLTGPAGAGKDTAFEFIRSWGDANGLLIKRDAFADRMKQSAAAAFGVGSSAAVAFCNQLKQPGVTIHIEGLTMPAPDFSGREFLQWYGTEAHREVFGEDFWTGVLFADISNEWKESDCVLVITDVRFPNEADAIYAAGGQVWKIDRPAAEGEAMSHVSELGIPKDQVSVTVANNGTLADLKRAVQTACNLCLGQPA